MKTLDEVMKEIKNTAYYSDSSSIEIDDALLEEILFKNFYEKEKE